MMNLTELKNLVNSVSVPKLPYVELQNKINLPAASGIYFVIDSSQTVLYIGKAAGKGGLKGRWKQHHKYSSVESLENIKIYYFVLDAVYTHEAEKLFIRRFNPILNGIRFYKLPDGVTVASESDLTGMVFGRLTVLRKNESYKDKPFNGRFRWDCECNCGKIINTSGYNLLAGYRLSCGCLNWLKVVQEKGDIIGENFGRLTVVDRVENSKNGSARFLCECECGNKKIYRRCDLTGKYKYVSCGCYSAEATRNRAKTHGMSKTRTYALWHSMIKNRTGVICDRWETFENFLEDMGEAPEKLVLAKINENGIFEKDNCEWVSRSELTKRIHSYYMITYNGKTQCANDWAKELGISSDAIIKRLNKGLPIDKVLSEFSERNLVVTLKGETKTVREWSRISGIHFNTLYNRFRTGVPVENFLDPVKETELVEYEDKKQTLYAWSKELNIQLETLYRRINEGRPLSEVFAKKRFIRERSIEFNGETKTLKEWSKTFNIRVSTIRSRINRGLPLEKVFEPEVRENQILITIDGVTKNLKEWAEFYGMSYKAVLGRHRKGLPLSEIFNSGKKGKNNYITINGITKSVRDWAKQYGISHATIFARIYKGWNPEQAVITPLNQKPS